MLMDVGKWELHKIIIYYLQSFSTTDILKVGQAQALQITWAIPLFKVCVLLSQDSDFVYVVTNILTIDLILKEIFQYDVCKSWWHNTP